MNLLSCLPKCFRSNNTYTRINSDESDITVNQESLNVIPQESQSNNSPISLTQMKITTYERDLINPPLAMDKAALIKEIENNRVDLVKSLLESNANPNFYGSAPNPYTPLSVAIMKDNNEIFELLVEYGADPNTQVKYNSYTPLAQAIFKNKVDLVKRLLELGANANGCINSDCYTPLYYALENKSCEIVKILLKSGAMVNADDKHSPLLRAIECGNKEAINLLIEEYGADINALQAYPYRHPQTALVYALSQNKLSMVEELLQYGADPNIKYQNITPIEYAIQHKYWDIVRILRCNLALLDDTKMMSEMMAHFGYDPLRDVSLYQRSCIIAKIHYQYSGISRFLGSFDFGA